MDVKTRTASDIGAVKSRNKFVKNIVKSVGRTVGRTVIRGGRDIVTAKAKNAQRLRSANKAETNAAEDVTQRGKRYVMRSKNSAARFLKKRVNRIINKSLPINQTRIATRILARSGRALLKMATAGIVSGTVGVIVIVVIVNCILFGGLSQSTTYGGFLSMPFDVNTTSFAVTSEYGSRTDPVYGGSAFHAGLDFGVPMDTPVVAAQTGTVMVTGYGEEMGNYVILMHTISGLEGNTLYTRYLHLDSISVHVGDTVIMGQVIALSGNTGKSTGPHLHFEIRDVNGDTQSPRVFLNYKE